MPYPSQKDWPLSMGRRIIKPWKAWLYDASRTGFSPGDPRGHRPPPMRLRGHRPPPLMGFRGHHPPPPPPHCHYRGGCLGFVLQMLAVVAIGLAVIAIALTAFWHSVSFWVRFFFCTFFYFPHLVILTEAKCKSVFRSPRGLAKIHMTFCYLKGWSP